jgi:hypothetical protein
MELIFIILTAFFILLCAYTFQFQRAIMEISLKLSCKREEKDVFTLQDIITPKSQFARNIFIYVLLSGIFVLGTTLFSWYWAVALLVFSLCIISPLLGHFMPQPDNPYYLHKIIKNLEKCLLDSRSEGSKEAQIRNILAKLKTLNPPSFYLGGKTRFSSNQN